MDTNPALLDGYLTTDEAAQQLGVHWRTLKRWAANGYGPPQVHVGHRVYYRRDEIAAWLNSLGPKPPAVGG